MESARFFKYPNSGKHYNTTLTTLGNSGILFQASLIRIEGVVNLVSNSNMGETTKDKTILNR